MQPVTPSTEVNDDLATGEAAEIRCTRDFERFLKRHGFSKRQAKRITAHGFTDPTITAAIQAETTKATNALERLRDIYAQINPNPEGADHEQHHSVSAAA